MLFSSWSVPSMFWCMELFLFSHRTLYFLLLSFVRFLSVHFSSLMSLWMVELLSAASATPPRFISCGNLLRIQQIQSYNPLADILNSVGPILIPELYRWCLASKQESVPLTAILWDSFKLPTYFSQISIHLAVHLSSLSMKILRETYLAKINTPYPVLSPYPTCWSFHHRRWSGWLGMTFSLIDPRWLMPSCPYFGNCF